MSYGQRYKHGDLPEALYIVTNGTSYKVYSSFAAAKGLRTRNNNTWYLRDSKWKIYRVLVDGMEEVE